MNENSPIWATPAATVSPTRGCWPSRATIPNAASGVATSDDQHDGHDGRDVGDQEAGVEEHPDGDEEQDREDLAQRQRVGGDLVARVGFADHRAGQECSQRERDAEHRVRDVGDAQRDRDRGEGEELAVTEASHQVE